MKTNQHVFNIALQGIIAQLDGTSPTDVRKLEEHLALMYKASNPKAYDPSNPAAVFSTAQYAKLFSFGFTALEDADGETFYFDENFELDNFKSQSGYVIADPDATSVHRTHAANQAVLSTMLKLLVHAAGSGGASDELALYTTGVIQDAMSQRNPQPAVLSDAYRKIIAAVLSDFKKDGAGEVVLDRLETLLTTRSETALIVDADGVARPDKG